MYIFFIDNMDDVLGCVCSLHLSRDYYRHFLQFLVLNILFKKIIIATLNQSLFGILIDRFPFYYELKIIVVLWLLSPATQGSSILYRKFVHPVLVKREQASLFPSLERGTDG